tara:strand:- start:3958 stop:4356 length:399 start_codon:yes stop_codon:yes gene_type:complete
MKEVQGFLFTALLFIFIVFSIDYIFNVEEVLASDNQSAMIKKISKDYSKKFCNSIAFGLSKESAMIFSLEENKKIFEKRKGVKNINRELIAEDIAISVADNCGFLININGEEDIQEFRNYYLLKDKESSEKG